MGLSAGDDSQPFLWENFEKITIKVRGYCLIKEMSIVCM